jgi:hypothetical protein
MGLESTCL